MLCDLGCPSFLDGTGFRLFVGFRWCARSRGSEIRLRGLWPRLVVLVRWICWIDKRGELAFRIRIGRRRSPELGGGGRYSPRNKDAVGFQEIRPFDRRSIGECSPEPVRFLRSRRWMRYMKRILARSQGSGPEPDLVLSGHFACRRNRVQCGQSKIGQTGRRLPYQRQKLVLRAGQDPIWEVDQIGTGIGRDGFRRIGADGIRDRGLDSSSQFPLQSVRQGGAVVFAWNPTQVQVQNVDDDRSIEIGKRFERFFERIHQFAPCPRDDRGFLPELQPRIQEGEVDLHPVDDVERHAQNQFLEGCWVSLSIRNRASRDDLLSSRRRTWGDPLLERR